MQLFELVSNESSYRLVRRRGTGCSGRRMHPRPLARPRDKPPCNASDEAVWKHVRKETSREGAERLFHQPSSAHSVYLTARGEERHAFERQRGRRIPPGGNRGRACISFSNYGNARGFEIFPYRASAGDYRDISIIRISIIKIIDILVNPRRIGRN